MAYGLYIGATVLHFVGRRARILSGADCNPYHYQSLAAVSCEMPFQSASREAALSWLEWPTSNPARRPKAESEGGLVWLLDRNRHFIGFKQAAVG